MTATTLSNTGFSQRFFALAILIATALFLSGCVSSSTSNTATYGGPSVSSSSAKLRSAKSDVRSAKRDLRKAERNEKAIKKKIKRTERKLGKKKLSKSAKADLKKRLRKEKKDLRKASRSVRTAKRSLTRAERAQRKADRAVAAAKRRMKDAEKRIAAEKRRKAEDEKKQAQQALAREGSNSSSYAARLFGRGDPALENINDYASRFDGGFGIAAIPVSKVNKRYLRQEVYYRSRHKKGTVIVDPHGKFLYLVMGNNRAMRYGIGVGRQGFEWQGTAYIGWKQKWPKWTPPEEMIAREPKLAKWGVDNGGMPGGPKNPLGARALYLFQDGKDTLYRLHGTPQWASIGTAASSGCIRLMNQDVIDLYTRVPNGAKVVVL